MNTINNRNSKKKSVKSNPYSFRAGWKKVPQYQVVEVREKIKAAIGIISYQNFYMRMTGKTIPKLNEAKAIEAVFAKYGITEIWGE